MTEPDGPDLVGIICLLIVIAVSIYLPCRLLME